MTAAVTISLDLWTQLGPEARRDLIASFGLPPLVRASVNRSNMTVTFSEPTADDLLTALGEGVQP